MVKIEGERVAHNVGNYDEVVNDEGIVFMDNPYIIIFLSDGVEYAADAIADISKVIYIYNANRGRECHKNVYSTFL